MSSYLAKEVEIIVPFWKTKKAAKYFERTNERPPTGISRVDVVRISFLIFTVYTLTIWGDARAINWFMEEMKEGF